VSYGTSKSAVSCKYHLSRPFAYLGVVVEGVASEGDVIEFAVVPQLPERDRDVVVEVVPPKTELVGRTHGCGSLKEGVKEVGLGENFRA
jgi:hypothetical protein